jgi:hypothetical protein
MLSDGDIKQAVDAGIINEEQALAISHLQRSRETVKSSISSDDEPFEIYRGFNEIFVTAGLTFTLLALGFLTAQVVSNIAAFALAHYYCKQKRMVLPGFLLSIVVAFSPGFFIFQLGELHAKYDFDRYLYATLLAGVMTSLFYHLYKVPFALFLAVVSMFIILLKLITGNDFTFEAMFNITQSPFTALITLGFGVGVFILAMVYDMRDPHRITRFSQTAFWLHLLAGSMVVNNVAYSLYNAGGLFIPLLVIWLLVLTVISIIIDRRSFLLASSAYLLTLLNYGSDYGDGPFYSVSFMINVLIVGVFLLILAMKWSSMRVWLMHGLPEFRLKDKLPPYHK